MRSLLVLSISMAAFMNCLNMGLGGPDLAGSVYTNVTRSESLSGAVGSKEGESCQQSFVGLAALGDASIEGAARAGNISTIQSVSFRNMAVLGSLYMKNCTLVSGQ